MEFSILRIYCIAIIIALFSSCEKDIEIDVPVAEDQLVVEGSIENGQPPVVLVSRTRGFFEPTSPEQIANSYISDAEVRVNGQQLSTVCLDEIPPELQGQVAELIGISPSDFDDFPICAYVGTGILGEFNTTYRLDVVSGNVQMQANTHIPNPITPDSSFFRLWANSNRFGYIFTQFQDPDTLNNAYRVFTKRIAPTTENNENPTDDIFYAPFGSTILDEFFNATELEIFFQRGQPFNSSRPSDLGDEQGFFEIGDIFVFKFCSVSEPTYQFYRTFEQQLGTNGSPFAAPNNLISNIEGGIGIWAGYSCVYDTIFALP